MTDRPLVLLSNDDGVHAHGLRALRAALLEWADVVVVAPESEQSASSHRITLANPLRHRDLGQGIHVVGGTPADCVYLALNLRGLLPRRPAMMLSGINHGFNLGMDVIYSGTVAAAREAALRGLRSMACSADPGADFESAARTCSALARRFLEVEPPAGPAVLLNVNLPASFPRGVLSTRLGRRDYEDVVEVRKDPRGVDYYWIGGPAFSHCGQEGADTTAIDRGYVSVTPLSLELSSAEHMAVAAFVAGPEGVAP